jgi:hypothetical protein
MKADGGDFDAAKPGAGREADRKFMLHFLIYAPAMCGYEKLIVK